MRISKCAYLIKQGETMKQIFEYSDYRKFLLEFMDFKKKESLYYSHRSILQKMGINSTGFLSNVLSGRNNLTTSQAMSLAKIFKLSSLETEYFINLVRFNQAKSNEEKKEHFGRIMSMRKVPVTLLNKKQHSLFYKWHYAVIRELLFFVPIKDDFKVLSDLIDPPIRPVEAREAVLALEEMGLVKKDAQGCYRQAEQVVSTGDELESFHVANFQQSTIEKAKRAIEKVKAANRDISVLTMTVSEESFKQMKTEIQLFRKKLLQMAAADNKVDRVYQCNINFFPVSSHYQEVGND